MTSSRLAAPILRLVVKPQIKYTLKEDKPPNKGQAESTLVYTLYNKSPLKRKAEWLVPKMSFIKRFHCTCSLIICRDNYPITVEPLEGIFGPINLSFIKG